MESKEDSLYATQAVQVTEKDGKFQAVIDVRDFNPRDLQVKVIDDRIVLEGRYDVISPDSKSSTSKAFYREFTLPPEADIDEIATALSKDGVLTIRAPKREGLPNFIQNSQSYESDRGFDTMSKDMKDRLLIADRDSGRSSGSGSPSCVSPSPSDTGSEASRVSSSMEFDIGRRGPFGRPEASFKVKSPDLSRSDSSTSTLTYGSRIGTPQNPQGMTLGSTSSISSLGSSSTIHEDAFRGTPTPSQTPQPTASFPPINPQSASPYSPTPSNASSAYSSNAPSYQMPQQNLCSSFDSPQRPLARSSGGTATITVKEEDGKKIQTSETSSVVQEKDGFLESKEIASEFTAGDRGQGASRQAQTRMKREEIDPSGRGKKSEAADASDVSESVVERRPDGSTVTTKKSSTTSSNVKQSFSTDPIFDSGFGDIRSLMGRGHSLMSQMSDDPFADMTSNLSTRMNSAFPSRMGNFSQFPDFPEMESAFANRPAFSNFPDRMGFSSDFPSNFPSQNFSNNFNKESKNEEEKVGPNGTSKTKTFTQSSQKSGFSSNFSDRKF